MYTWLPRVMSCLLTCSIVNALQWLVGLCGWSVLVSDWQDWYIQVHSDAGPVSGACQLPGFALRGTDMEQAGRWFFPIPDY